MERNIPVHWPNSGSHIWAYIRIPWRTCWNSLLGTPESLRSRPFRLKARSKKQECQPCLARDVDSWPPLPSSNQTLHLNKCPRWFKDMQNFRSTSPNSLSCIYWSWSSNTTEPASPFTLLFSSICQWRFPSFLLFQQTNSICIWFSKVSVQRLAPLCFYDSTIIKIFTFCIICITQWFVWDGHKTDACAPPAFLM